MAPLSLFNLALLATAAIAAPSHQKLVFKRALGPRQDQCAPNDDAGNPYVARIGYYSEHDCNDKVSTFCLYTYQGTIDTGSGSYSCAIAGLPDTTPFYAKVEDSPFDDMQVVFTRDQTCPPNGPGAVFATLIDNASCVLFNLGGDAPGTSVYPHGGAPIARKQVKRDGAKCSGFTIESQTPSESQTVQVSNIVDCVNGAESGCEIQISQEHTESVSTSMSVTAGGGIEGIFSIETTLGVEYTQSDTTAVQEGFSIPAGQKGYLAAYSGATLFKGKFTGCDSGDAEQPGQVLAIKKNAFHYSTVLTGARKAAVADA